MKFSIFVIDKSTKICYMNMLKLNKIELFINKIMLGNDVKNEGQELLFRIHSFDKVKYIMF